MRVAVVAAALALAPFLASAADLTRARYLMGTVCEITVPQSEKAETQIQAAFVEGDRVQSLISTWRDDTELARLNAGAITTISPELRWLLTTAIQYEKKTGGAFNPLMRPLIDAWDTRGEGRVPTREEREAARKRTNILNVVYDNDSMRLANGAQFEEGGFGKGYALDRMLAVLRRNGATDAVINFGGQIAEYGETLPVSIADPRDRTKPLASFVITGGSVSTSSGSEKSFSTGGRRFTHLIDPATGEALPPRGSVSVVHESALIADILSTALYVMGPEAGLRWARKNGVVAIFISETGEITTSSAIEGLTRVKEQKH